MVDNIQDAAAIQPYEAVLNITYNGQQGTLRDPIAFDANDGDVKQWASEALRAGNVPGIDALPHVDLADFVVDRFAAKDGLAHRVSLRPKTPFGK